MRRGSATIGYLTPDLPNQNRPSKQFALMTDEDNDNTHAVETIARNIA
jgi:hypothetical protein